MHGSDHWLAFTGPSEVALGAWSVSAPADGKVELQPLASWPVGVRVVSELVDEHVAYVILETLGVLDQPAGLRAAWSMSTDGASPFEASPLALGDVRDADDLAERLKNPPPVASTQRNASSLMATLRAASANKEALSKALADEGLDIGVCWQGLFVQRVHHLDAQTFSASNDAAEVLAVVREALATHACGADACEAWTAHGRAVVRLVVEGGRWALRAVIEDASAARGSGNGAPHEVQTKQDPAATRAYLNARTRTSEILGEASLDDLGGTIGVAMTDLEPDAPAVVVQQGLATRLFVLPVGSLRAAAGDAHWETAFADVNGDGRTDVVVRMVGQHADGPLSWTQAFLAPEPSVQETSLESDLPSALAVMDASSAADAAHLAVAIPQRAVSHDDACRVMAVARTPAGLRRVAAPDARLLRFDDPGLPTWRPHVVSLDHVTPDDARDLGMHCAELTCDARRPYCSWSVGTDSQHAWFGWRDDRLQLLGAADYVGE